MCALGTATPRPHEKQRWFTIFGVSLQPPDAHGWVAEADLYGIMIFLRKVSIRELGLGNIRCEVQLAVKAVPNGGIHVTFRHPSDEAFSHAIILGAQSVIDRFLVGSNVAGIDILVLFIWKPTFGQPHTDIVSMLTAQCTCAAFGVPDFQMPYFDREKRRVIYPI